MDETRYHINPETGRPNKCVATGKRGCKYKNEDGTEPPHFPSKEAAQAHQNSKDEKEYGAFATLKKKGTDNKAESEESVISEGVAGDQSEAPQLEETGRGDSAARDDRMGAGTQWRALLDQDPHAPTKKESEQEANEMYREFEAITGEDYEMGDAINGYAGTKYRYVNRLLRSGMEWDEADDIIAEGEGEDHDDPDYLIEDVEDVITAMDNAFERNAELGLEKPRALYRVMEIPGYTPDDYIKRKFEVGCSLHEYEPGSLLCGWCGTQG